MLYLYFHKRSIVKPLTRGTDGEFSDRYCPEWSQDEEVKRIVRELDNSEFIAEYVVKSPVLGGISPDSLSATCRNVIMAYEGVDMTISSSFMDDAAAPYLEEISKNKDIHIYMNHPFKWTDTQVATLVDCDNYVATGEEDIYWKWVNEYDYEERAWDVGWSDKQLREMGDYYGLQ